jgi:dihydroorotate dehydrogenase
VRQNRAVSALLPRLAMPFLRLLDAERAHTMALAGLRAGLAGAAHHQTDLRLAISVLGVTLPNPIGLAAGFDKDATALAALMRQGFGAIEAGTVTPLAQTGNPRPRLFRLPAERAVINRMGFNSGGMAAFAPRFRAAPRNIPLGANVGPNRQGGSPMEDFPMLAAAVAGRADWITLNVSSPNTPGLRDLQAPRALGAILAAIRRQVPGVPPLLVKLSPDLAWEDLPDIVEACVEHGAAGLIVANTTLARPVGLRGRAARESGGLSGVPLMAPSTRLLAQVARLARGRLVLVGCGGVASGADVLAKLRAGASFVQLYTAFAYHGPPLLARLHREILACLDRDGLPDIRAAIGASLRT